MKRVSTCIIVRRKPYGDIIFFRLKYKLIKKFQRNPNKIFMQYFFTPKKQKWKTFFPQKNWNFARCSNKFWEKNQPLKKISFAKAFVVRNELGKYNNTAIRFPLLKRRCFCTTNNLKPNQPPHFFSFPKEGKKSYFVSWKKLESCSWKILFKQLQRLHFTKRLFT